jgi:F-type H+-transporting ATPase subunit gamma
MRDIRRRIKTVRNIQQITKALKMVAAARLQRAENNAKAARPYAEEMQAVISRLAAAGEVSHPLLEVREPANIGILIITSDRGMAGSYNSNILRKVNDMVKEYGKDRVKMITVGKKGRAFFTRQGVDIVADFPMPSSEVTFAEAKSISRKMQDMFQQHQVDVIHIVFTRFYTAMTQRATDMQVLPAVPPSAAEEAEAQSEDFIFEPEPEVLLGNILPRYVDTEVYRAMLESLASEHGARMTAMSSATDSAGEMIDRLTLDLNRARQAAITKELSEIVSGAEALK